MLCVLFCLFQIAHLASHLHFQFAHLRLFAAGFTGGIVCVIYVYNRYYQLFKGLIFAHSLLTFVLQNTIKGFQDKQDPGNCRSEKKVEFLMVVLLYRPEIVADHSKNLRPLWA